MGSIQDILFGTYIIDGVGKTLSPADILAGVLTEPLVLPDGDLPSVADEYPDVSSTPPELSPADIPSFLKLLPLEPRTMALPFAGPLTSAILAQALIDAIWQNGHFCLEDLSVKASWHWEAEGIGNAAAFYSSVEDVCTYMDALGVRMSSFRLVKGAPAVSFKAGVVPVAGRRKCPRALVPSRQDWLIYIPFDSCDFRLGGSALMAALGKEAPTAPDVSDADYFMDCYEVLRELVEDGVVKAGATVREGGLVQALHSMCPEGCGADINIDDICRAYGGENPVRVLFSEVPGVIIQIADTDYDYVDAELLLQDVMFFPIGHPSPGTQGIKITDKVGLPEILSSLLGGLEGED